jgi:hypothetical protein
VRGHIAVCVLAAVVEQLIGNRPAAADLREPDLDEQHLSADRAIQELDRIARSPSRPAARPSPPSAAATACNSRSWPPSASTPERGPGHH